VQYARRALWAHTAQQVRTSVWIVKQGHTMRFLEEQRYDGCEQGGAGCNECCAGTFSESPGSIVCVDCVAGKYSSVVGAASVLECQTCPASTVSSSGSTSSAACLCAPGTYSVDSGCIACDAGKYSTAVGAEGQGVCNSCVEGTYSDAMASTACTKCPPGKTSESGASALVGCQ